MTSSLFGPSTAATSATNAASQAIASQAASGLASGGGGAGALSSLSTNYNSFLKLLTTQLQNQNPSSPMDTAQFTSELAQFAGVEQQISTNSNLTNLIQLAQSQQVLQGASILGKQVDLNATTLPLQSSAANLAYTATTIQPVQITVQDATGTTIFAQNLAPTIGSNSWRWNGRNEAGVQLPDGPYTALVAAIDGKGVATPLAFTTGGTVTGVSRTGANIDLQMGATTVSMSRVADVRN